MSVWVDIGYLNYAYHNNIKFRFSVAPSLIVNYETMIGLLFPIQSVSLNPDPVNKDANKT